MNQYIKPEPSADWEEHKVFVITQLVSMGASQSDAEELWGLGEDSVQSYLELHPYTAYSEMLDDILNEGEDL